MDGLENKLDEEVMVRRTRPMERQRKGRKTPAFSRIKGWSEQWGLRKKGVRSEWEEAGDAQDISGIQMDL